MYYIQTESTDEIINMQAHEGEGLIRRRHLFKAQTELPIHAEIWELDQGVSEGAHIHDNTDTSNGSLEEIYYFIEGEGSMTVDGEEITVQAGDAIMAPPGSNHGIRGTSSQPLKFMIIWGPPA